MRVNLAYGRGRLPVDLPAEPTTVLEPTYIQGLPDQRQAVRDAIRNPLASPALGDVVKAGQTVAISICDSTRPMPSRTVLPVVLEELSHTPGLKVVILVATGTHRASTDAELLEMVGEEVVNSYELVNHDAFDRATLAQLPDAGSGVPVWLNRRWVDADVRITTGFVEPHFFAGFSGGPKMVAPGLAGFDTTMRLHDAEMIGSPNARWGVTVGNPIHDAVRLIAEQCGVHFSVDVAINRDRQITSVRAGNLFAVHETMCEIVKRSAMQAFDAPFDVVLTTNSGYPLDQNLYQTIKGISAAAQVVKDGGLILCAAECADGLPAHGEYGNILTSRSTPQALLEMICEPGHNRHDQWEVQVQAQIQRRAEVLLKSEGLSDTQVRAAHLTPIEDVGAATRDHLSRLGPSARLCVLPEGPQTIPYLEERTSGHRL
jgi:nickel-dependent lactate racemase